MALHCFIQNVLVLTNIVLLVIENVSDLLMNIIISVFNKFMEIVLLVMIWFNQLMRNVMCVY
jgi:hypothetical protein